MIALIALVAFAGEPTKEELALQPTGGTPWTIGRGRWAAGVFRPITIGVADRVDLVTTGVVGSLLSPRLDVKVGLREGDQWSVAVVGGLNVPTPVLLLSKGYLFDPSEKVPFAVLAKAGATAGVRVGDVTLSGTVLVRLGLAFGEHDLTRRDFYWLDPALAPVTDGPVGGRLELQADWFPSAAWAGGTVDVGIHLGGPGPDFDARLLALARLGRHTALGVGVVAAIERRTNGYWAYWLPVGDFELRY